MKKILFLLVSVVWLAACSNQESDPKARLEQMKKEYDAIGKEIKKLEAEIRSKGGQGGAEKTQLVSVAGLAPQPFFHYIELQGKVNAEENVVVTPQIPGTIQEIFVAVGQQVKKGQLLAEVDNDAAKKNLETLKTQLSFARDIYNKQEALWKEKIGTEVQYLSAKNNVETLESQVAAAQEQINMSRLVSPINGVVDAVDIKVGQIASPGLAGIRVLNFNKLKVEGEVSESYSAVVHQGDKVRIYFPDLKKEIESTISYSSRVIDPQSRTFTVESRLAVSDAFKPNMIAVMKIMDYEKSDAIVVGVNLIQKSGDGEYVFVAVEENGRIEARRQAVKVGRIYGGQAEITEGLKPGDLVVTVGYQDLVSGQALQYQS